MVKIITELPIRSLLHRDGSRLLQRTGGCLFLAEQAKINKGDTIRSKGFRFHPAFLPTDRNRQSCLWQIQEILTCLTERPEKQGVFCIICTKIYAKEAKTLGGYCTYKAKKPWYNGGVRGRTASESLIRRASHSPPRTICSCKVRRPGKKRAERKEGKAK